ncbi:MAG: TonB-dependent receptor [Gemmatimonadota bacterium]
MRLSKPVLLLSLIVLPLRVSAQQGTGAITGTVTSAETGQALPQVEVTVPGTSHRGITATNGRYLIVNVPAGMHSVSVTMLGYADHVVQDVPVVSGETAVLNIQLTPTAIALAEVVVVGYGQQRRATITGAVESVTGEALENTPVVNLQTALAGRMSGVIVNNRTGVPGSEETAIRVRGAATLPSGNFDGGLGPLVVIDGVADREGGFSRLNPDDIESLTVLKDASAAIYGAQAGAGVILITTKQGTGPTQIRYNGNIGFSSSTYLPELVEAADYAIYINELLEREGEPRQYTDEEIQMFRDGSDPVNYPNTDWIEEILRDGPAPQQDHSLQVSGSTDDLRYFVSGRFLTQDAILRNAALQYNQYSLRSNLSSRIHPNLNVGLRLHGRYEAEDAPNRSANDVFEQASRNYPTAHAWFPNGYPSTGVEFNNPVVMTDGRTGYDNTRDWFAQSNVDFRLDMPFLTQGLYATGMAAFDLSYSDSKTMNFMYDWFEYDRQSGEYISYRDRTGPLNLGIDTDNAYQRTLNARIGWDRAFGNHSFQTFVAHERYQEHTRALDADRSRLPSDQIQDLFVGDTEGMSNNSSTGQGARAHYFGRLSYSYDDRYIGEFTLRHDGSERFPEEGRWGTFPAVAAAWRISSEPFFNIDAVTDLKLKASWGRLGNDGSGSFQHLALYNTTQNAYIFGGSPVRAFGLNPGVAPNPNITWEKVEKQNYGVEATLWNGRISTDLNYFRDYRSDILMSRGATVPAYAGLNLPNENLGEVAHHGFDGSVSVNGELGAARWYLSPNLTWAKSRIVVMNESPNIPDHQRQIGHQVGSMLLYQDCGLFRSQAEIDARPHLNGTLPGDVCFEDVNGDGTINNDDRVRIYDSDDPRMQYGVNLGGRAGGFTLDMVWQGQGGSKIIVQPMQINATVTPPTWIFEDRWTPENPDARWPASFDRLNGRSYVQSTFWLQDATFFRLKSASLSYTIPESLVSRVALGSLQLTLSGFNLLTFSGINDYDPELNEVNTYYYPQQRVINFGITAGL